MSNHITTPVSSTKRFVSDRAHLILDEALAFCLAQPQRKYVQLLITGVDTDQLGLPGYFEGYLTFTDDAPVEDVGAQLSLIAVPA